MSRCREIRVAVALLGALCRESSALFLDDDKNFKLTGLFYSQARVRIVDTNPPHGPQTNPFYQGGTPLAVHPGSLSQWRNFAQPAFEGALLPLLHTTLLDDLSFRFVGRFTYDGIYDVGPDVYRRALRAFKVSAGTSPLGGTQPVAIFKGTDKVEMEGSPDKAAQRARRIADQEIWDPREQFARQADPWEIYVNLKKGPAFLRVGRQNLSWGETDGLRLLDVINPIDNFFGLTFDEDLDEKRIPLWMIRGIYDLPELWEISHDAVEGFIVPGVVDTTQSPILFQGFLHPFAPPTGCDAQLIADNTVAALSNQAPSPFTVPPGCNNALPDGSPLRGRVKVSLYERLPKKEWRSSRFGARLTGVLFRNYTVSVGAYRTWADAPNGLAHYLDRFPGPNGSQIPTTNVIELVHGPETIVGGTLSFFQPRLLPGVVRMEGGYFLGEPTCSRQACQGNPLIGQVDTYVPRADFVRWSFGYDVFDLNVPWLSQTNNVIIIAQMFNSFRLTPNDRGLIALAKQGGLPAKYAKLELVENPARNGSALLPSVANRYNAIWSVAVQNYMMHGNLNPQIIGVLLTEGDFGILPSVVYHFTDSLQVKVGVAYIGGAFSTLGLFRDRSQAGVRVSYLLN